jgi:hypothetical protein
MKNIFATITLLGLVVFSGCRDEDVIRQPDWVTPVIPLAITPDGSNAKANVEDPFVLDDLGNSVYDFILDIEDFDGAEDGHRFFVGRSGPTSTLIDFTLFIDYSGNEGDPAVFAEYQPSDFPVTINITPQDAVSFFSGLAVSDLADGDAFELSFEYRIDANNTGQIRTLALPSSDYCGGFSDQGEFCTLTIEVVDTLDEG